MPPGMTSRSVASTTVWPAGVDVGGDRGDVFAFDEDVGLLVTVGVDDGAVLDQGSHMPLRA